VHTETKTELFGLSVSELDGNVRERERVLELEIRNLSSSPVVLTSLDQLVQHRVQLNRALSSSFVNAEEEYKDLCRDLSILINSEYSFRVREVIERRKAIFTEIADDVIGKTVIGYLPKVLKMILRGTFTGNLIRRHFQERFMATRLSIDNYSQAAAAVEFVQKHGTDHNGSLLPLIESKLSMLKELDSERSPSGTGSFGIEIQGHQSHREKFVLNFPQAILGNHSYTVEFRVRVKTMQPEGAATTRQVSHSVMVAANSVVLSAVAVFFSVGGLASRLVIDNPAVTGHEIFQQLFFRPSLIVPCFVSFLVFNVYERIGLPMAKQIAPSWWSAALIGFLCGLATDNFLAALKAFFGIR